MVKLIRQMSTYPYLQKLDISENSISSLVSGAFSGLPMLKDMDMSQNDLHTIYSEYFVGTKALSGRKQYHPDFICRHTCT